MYPISISSRIRYFVAVAEERHFGRAAEKLHMSQPPLSQQIQLLEKELGTQLLTRTTRRVELTEAGVILYEGAKRALDQLEQAILHAQRVQRGEAGLLRVGFVSTAAFQLLSDVLRAFRQRYPQATLELFHLTSAQQAAAFEARTIDVGFLREPPGGNVMVEVIDKDPLVVALPVTHPLAKRTSVPMRALKDQPFVMWDRQQTAGIAQTILDLCTRHGFHPIIALEVTNPPAMLSLVAGGVGIAIVPLSATHLRSEAVVFRPVDDKNAYSPMALAWRNDNTRELLPRFIALVREICRKSTRVRRAQPRALAS
jgi:DNA-binding transcriptional LysR family regulator